MSNKLRAVNPNSIGVKYNSISHLSNFLDLSLCLSVSLSLCLSVSLSLCPPVPLSLCLSVSLYLGSPTVHGAAHGPGGAEDLADGAGEVTSQGTGTQHSRSENC